MKLVFNVIWLVLAGIPLAIGYVIGAIVQAVTIIGIPFAVQSLKLAGYALWPFGRVVIERPGQDVAVSCLGNVLWLVLTGWLLVLAHVLTALLLFVTIIGIPLGVANLKMANLALAPFGRIVVSEAALRAGHYAGATIVSDVPEGPRG